VLLMTDAMRAATLEVLVMPRLDAEAFDPSKFDTRTLGPWQKLALDDVALECRQLTVSVRTPAWAVNVTSKPIYGLVPPLYNETHVHTHWEEGQKRLDLSIHGAFPNADAHGVIGQSYRGGARRDGALDAYGVEGTPERADSDGQLPPLTTAAQAEGAIDGVYTDYQLDAPFSTSFRYSHFDAKPTQPAVGANVEMRAASTSEWDGKKEWVGKKREA
jgi:hypothetical protein